MEKRFQDMQVCKDFKHKNKDKILLYIELLYNKKSKLNNIEDLWQRKLEACKQAGLASDDMKDIMEMKDLIVNDLIFHYQSYFQNSNKHQKLLSDQQLFWNMQKILNSSIPEGDEDDTEKKMSARNKISENCDQLLSRIDRLLSEIYSQDMIETAEITIRQLMTPEMRLKKK